MGLGVGWLEHGDGGRDGFRIRVQDIIVHSSSIDMVVPPPAVLSVLVLVAGFRTSTASGNRSNRWRG